MKFMLLTATIGLWSTCSYSESHPLLKDAAYRALFTDNPTVAVLPGDEYLVPVIEDATAILGIGEVVEDCGYADICVHTVDNLPYPRAGVAMRHATSSCEIQVQEGLVASWVIAHEIGHCLGFNHNPVDGHIMSRAVGPHSRMSVDEFEAIDVIKREIRVRGGVEL